MEAENEGCQVNDEIEPEDQEDVEEDGDMQYVEEKDDKVEVEVEDEGESEGKTTIDNLEEEEAQEEK